MEDCFHVLEVATWQHLMVLVVVWTAFVIHPIFILLASAVRVDDDDHDEFSDLVKEVDTTKGDSGTEDGLQGCDYECDIHIIFLLDV